MWGVSGEGGEVENPSLIPPLKKILQVCTIPEEAPDKAELVKLDFEKGIPVALNGKKMKLSALITQLNKIAAKHAVGISLHIEDRVVGMKIRDLYEAPAAEAILTAHKHLEKFVCTRQENFFKVTIDEQWSYLCYGGLWHEPLMAELNAFADKLNEKVTGTVTVKLYKGNCNVVALDSKNALFDAKLATFFKDKTFNQNASAGFIELYSLQMKLANQIGK